MSKSLLSYFVDKNYNNKFINEPQEKTFDIKIISSSEKFNKNCDNYNIKLKADKNYKENNYLFYEDLINNKIINSKSVRYKPEYFIRDNYCLITNIFESEKYSNLIKNDIIEKYDFFFAEKIIHDKIVLNIDIKNSTVRGNIIDGAFSYLYDNTINLYEYINDSTDNILQELISDGKIYDNESAIKIIFGEQLQKAKEKLDKNYSNIKANMLIYNHEIKSYGYPDLISDNAIIDIKTSMKNNIINPTNYLQIIAYGFISGYKNICIYDILNGIIYEGKINNYNKIKQYFSSKIDNIIDEKKYKKIRITNNSKFKNYLKYCDDY